LNKEDKPQSKIKGFFTFSPTLINEIVKLGGGAEELSAYLVIKRGAGAKTYSNWGANSVAQYIGLSFHRANQCIHWLEEHEFIKRLATTKNGDSQKSNSKWQFKIDEDEIEIALSNALIDGVGAGNKNPPLLRLRNEIDMGKWGIRSSRIDAFVVLMSLYRYHCLAEYGGIDPLQGVYKRWQAAENYEGIQITELPGTDAALYEIKASEDIVYKYFANQTLIYVSNDEERYQRFWEAFNNLKYLGWLYQTTQIWSADPSVNKDAEPLYTLYVHDRHARHTDSYLANLINKISINQLNPDYGFFNSSGEFEDEFDHFKGQFRYVALKKQGGFPIGIYRLKFRPHTRDTGKGMAEEEIRQKRWEKALYGVLDSL
jgi:hypothetical protein